ncbi:MAG TPA: pyrroloquinoline quinone biosynthesis protein PqqB [Nitrospira sp.]|nr:pyrroloquinoline quinone biosynthesis protein PqqB [Nitrospira sp.]
MRIHVLGSAAGGAFPQWNCGCPNCAGLRAGTIAATPRKQASIALSDSEGNCFLIHAAPDIGAQFAAFPALHPRALRDSPLAGIILTNGDLDQCLGLLSLRESQPLHVYATESVRQAVTQNNRFYRALDRSPGQVTWHELKLYGSQTLLTADHRPTQLVVTAIPVPGKVPLYLEGQVAPQMEDNVALLVSEMTGGPCLGHAPCVGGINPDVERVVELADCLFFDGTFWSEDELVALGIGTKTAHDMAHWPLAGSHGSLSMLAKSPSRRILIHINNTNPILRDDSPERRQLERAGIEVAYDGMEVIL